MENVTLAVAGFPDKEFPNGAPLTVASKYPAIAKDYFNGQGIRVETIKLNGSIELAPLIGMADVIVDIVETGTTLKENGLVVLEKIADVSARFIVNKASYATKNESNPAIHRGFKSRIGVKIYANCNVGTIQMKKMSRQMEPVQSNDFEFDKTVLGIIGNSP